MRRVGSAPGLAFGVAALKLRRSAVASSAALTCSVVFTRVDRNASGANRMNHWLNWSTEAAMSAFQRCGLFAFILPLRTALLHRGSRSLDRCRHTAALARSCYLTGGRHDAVIH